MFITRTRKKGKTHCIKSAEIRTSKSSVFGQFSRSATVLSHKRIALPLLRTIKKFGEKKFSNL